jgi:hypothetical protein
LSPDRIISNLNENSGAIQAFCAFVIAIVTIVYVVFTARMWREMRRTNERLDRPNVQAVLAFKRPYVAVLGLTIKNWGTVPVYDVRVDIDPRDLPGLTRDTVLGDLNLFNTSIPVLTEREEISTLLLDWRRAKGDREKAPKVTFTVSYNTADGNRKTQIYTYNLSVYENLVIHSAETHSLEKPLKEAMTSLKDTVRSGMENIVEQLEWGTMLPRRELNGEVPLPTLLNVFSTAWVDFKSFGEDSFDHLSFRRMVLLCQNIYDRLCFCETEENCTELRQKFLAMTRLRPSPFIGDNEPEEQFLAHGDEAVALIRRMKNDLDAWDDLPLSSPWG